MKIDLANGELNLSENQPIRIVAAKGARICCLNGTIWITQTGQFEDVFLLAGQVCQIDNQHLVLIESIGIGRIRITAPAKNTFGQGWCSGMQEKWLPVSRCGGVA